MSKDTKPNFRQAILDRMGELEIKSIHGLHRRLGEKTPVHRSHLYSYLKHQTDMAGDRIEDILDALDIVIVPRWRVLR